MFVTIEGSSWPSISFLYEYFLHDCLEVDSYYKERIDNVLYWQDYFVI